jgi:hemoglobin-like flavoprotein
MQNLAHAMSRPAFMTPGLRDLGRRHDGYGVTDKYYTAFRQPFLESARATLGQRHTPQVEKAWADTIDLITGSMRGPLAS